MERKKTRKLIITFATTTAAMAMEAACTEGEGRLIPIPSQISAGCGLAWCADPGLEEILIRRMADKGISWQEKRLLEMY